MTGSIRVLVADDHAVVRQGLNLFLELQEDIEVVAEASDGAEAIDRAISLTPDVVLMDLLMPNISGVEATLRIKEECPRTQVLVLTSFLEDETVRDVLRAGALGYLMKDAEPMEVADAIRTVHRGDPLLHPEVLRRVVGGFATQGRADTPSGSAGMATIAFTDVENSTAMIRDLGDAESRPIFREHDQIVRDVVGTHGGREVQHLGDGFVLAFASARSAVGCSIDVQRAFSEYSQTHQDRPLRVRIGMHTGEVIAEDHGYFGEAVWIAARILSKADGGQILVSDLTRQVVGSSCPCRDRGEFDLKGFPGVHRLHEVSWSPT